MNTPFSVTLILLSTKMKSNKKNTANMAIAKPQFKTPESGIQKRKNTPNIGPMLEKHSKDIYILGLIIVNVIAHNPIFRLLLKLPKFRQYCLTFSAQFSSSVQHYSQKIINFVSISVIGTALYMQVKALYLRAFLSIKKFLF